MGFSSSRATLTFSHACFIKISKPVRAGTAYHDVFVNILNIFPTVNDAKDIQKWRQFIHLCGLPALYFFADCQSFTSVPETLKEAKTAQLEKTYPRAGEAIEFAELCKSHLISNSGFEAGLDYILTGWPKKEKDNLPIVNIKVVDANEEYRWVKLPPDDKLALYLGNMIPGCCQFINGDSKQCVIDGTSLSDNGFYVLLKKKIKKPGESVTEEVSNLVDGDIVAQSYAWISKNGNLCLDSLEWDKKRVSEAVLKTLMSNFADGVLIKYPQIKYVNVGAAGQTPRQFGPRALLSETQRQGTEYGDASSQYCIQSKLTPERTEMLNAKPEFNQLYETVQKKIQYLSAYLEPKDLSADTIGSMSSLLETSFFKPFPPIYKPLMAEDFKVLTFEQYQTLSKDKRQSISTFCKLLNCENLDSFMRWLPTIRAEELLNILKIEIQAGNTILHLAAINPESLRAILGSLPEQDRLAAVQIENRSEYTILTLAASNPESLRAILEILPEQDRFVAVQAKNRYYQTVLHLAAHNPEAINIILNVIPEEERLAAVQAESSDGEKLLPLAASNPESLRAILALLPEQDRLAAVKEKYDDDVTVLHLAANKPESLEIILECLPAGERLDMVKAKDVAGETVVHKAISIPHALNAIVKLLSEEERFGVIKEEVDFLIIRNQSWFHSTLALIDSESVKIILETLPMQERLNAIMHLPLHKATHNKKHLEEILKLLPAEALIEAFKLKDEKGDTVLHTACFNPESLKLILQKLTHEDLQSFLTNETNKKMETVLDLAATNPESLQAILDFFPENRRLALLEDCGLFTTNLQSLQTILKLLPENERLPFLNIKHRDDLTVLHLIASHPESLRAILGLVPEQDRLAAVQEKDYDKMTLLHRVASNPESLRAILETLPEQNRLAAVQEKDLKGQTLFDKAKPYPESLKVIQMLVPQKTDPSSSLSKLSMFPSNGTATDNSEEVYTPKKT